MARQVITHTEYTDDIDGSAAAGTVSFAYDGTHYEIDLSKRNSAAFEKAMRPYLEAARKVRRSRGRTTPRRSSNKHDLAEVRAWAAKNGYDVSERGRIAAAVLSAYEDAH
jgi:Lsr2